jgi:ketosteroid isomerase-like protein
MIKRFSGLAAFLLCAVSSTAEAQGILGANAGRHRKEAAEYRERTRSEVMQLIGELGEKWDDADPGKPARYYDNNATIVLGPNRSIQGRPEIRAEFEKTLRRMHGVLFTMEDYDLSGDLIFIRGTMSYELIRHDAPAARDSASFAMTFRPRRDGWMIQTLLIGGAPPLVDTRSAVAAASRSGSSQER